MSALDWGHGPRCSATVKALGRSEAFQRERIDDRFVIRRIIFGGGIVLDTEDRPLADRTWQQLTSEDTAE